MRLFEKSSILVFALLVWPCLATSQTATVVQSKSGFATGGTNPAVSFPSNNTAGNLLWVAVGSDATIITPTDTLGNNYTLAVKATGSGGSGNAAIYYVRSALAGANTVTCNHSGNGNTHCHIAEINGLVATSPLDQTGSVGSSSSCGVSTSGATTQANEWIGAFFYDSPNNKTLIAGTGYTKVQLSNNSSSGDSALSESQNAGSTGVQTATCGGNSSNVLSQLITTFKASGAGSGPFITSLTPTSGAAGTSVTIKGSNFGSPQGSSTVTFNGTSTTPSSWSSTSVVAPVPSGATTGNVVITVAGTSSNGVNFTVPPGPATVVQSKSGFATGGTNPSVTFPNKNTAGNLLWVAVGSDATITTPTDTLGNTYTLAVSATGSGGSGNAAIYYTSSARAGTNSVTCNHSGNGNTHCHIAEISGLVTSSPLDQTGNVASSASCTVSTGAATTQAKEWVAAFFYDSPTNNTLTAGNGYTKIQLSNNSSSGDSALSESQNVSSTGVQTATCSGNSSNVLSQLITTFKTQGSSSSITDFNPKSAPVGTVIAITGTSLTSPGSPQVTLNQQGGGTVSAPIVTATDTTLSFVIPAGATSGPVTVTTGGSSVVSSATLNVVASSSFSVSANPSSANVQQGTSTSYSVTLASGTGFSQLAALSVTGVPTGVTTSFSPAQITAGQISILTVTAPTSQPVGSATLTISAAATVEGIPTTQSAGVSLAVQAASTSLIGRIVESDNNETPIPGIVATFLGVDDAGNKTGCSGQTRSDAAGNFGFTNLGSSCLGRQLIAYDGNTATDGEKYAGVNLAYTIVSGQITGPELVHLPAISDAETIMVKQNATVDQIFSYSTIPGIVVTVYAGTTLTLPDGTQPDPFPMAAVLVPVDRLPDAPSPTAGTLRASIVAFQPANTTSSLPVSVTFPNVVNTPPGVNMELDTLDPIVGELVKYGTGTVSADATEIVPDPDPAHPGHRFGISHFDWHGPMAPAPNNNNPSPDPNSPESGEPVDDATGLQVLTVADIGFGGVRGQVSIQRTYRTLSGNPGPFGVGTNHNYGYLLDTSNLIRGTGTFVNLVMPDGNQFQFAQQGTKTFVNSSIPSLLGAVVTSPTSETYNLRWKNGTVFQFQSIGGALLAFLTSITDANGNTTTLVRGNSSQPIQITQIIDPVGKALNLSYDNFNRILSITDPIGRSVQYTYNSQGTLASVANPAGGVTVYGYDSQNRMTSITDPRNITYLQNTYDANGRVMQQTAADGGVTKFAYTLLNPLVATSPILLTTVTDPLGNQTTYHFNPQGFLIDTTDALGEKTAYTLDSGTNQVLTITDPLGRTTAFTYDSVGNRTGITRLAGTPNSATTSLTYDPVFGNVASITDPLGHTTVYKYDNAGNVTTVTDPLGQQSAFTYDANGELTASTDPMGNTTKFAYGNGNLTSITDPLGGVTTRVNDAAGRVVSFTNALGQPTTYQYNPLNQLTQVTDPQSNQTSFAFDGNGNLLSLTDARGNKTSYTYDKMDRFSTRTDPLGHSESVQYDLAGNLIRLTDRRGVETAYSYDTLNRKTQVNFGGQETINYSYDAAGRLLQAVHSVTGTIARSYDPLDRLVSETTQQGNISYSYDAAGRRISMLVSGQQPVAYSYDNGNRLVQIAQGSSKVTLNYDNDGRRTSLTLPNGVTMSYSYDAASQLTGINYGSLGNLTYSYDLVGRRSSVGGSFARTGMPNVLTSASYNADSQLTQFGSSNLTYDANGNLTSDAANTYTWSARNQLASISGGVAANFQYDAFGRRVSKTTGRTTKYLYDGVNPVEEFSDTTVTATTLTGFAVDEYFQRMGADGPINFLTDALGSTVAVTGVTDATLASYTYEPFGNTTVNGSSSNPYEFTGRENDGTGLYFYRNRYYNPTFQRFISQDPLDFGGGGPNLYVYGLNEPTSYIDPLGLDVTITYYQGRSINVFGHIGIAVNNNQPVGFDPCPFSVCLTTIPDLVPGEVDPIANGRASRDSITIPTTPEQDQAIQSYINGRAAHPGLYDLFGRNCTQFAQDALRAAGLPAPHDILPSHLLNDLHRMYDAPEPPLPPSVFNQMYTPVGDGLYVQRDPFQ